MYRCYSYAIKMNNLPESQEMASGRGMEFEERDIKIQNQPKEEIERMA